MTRNLAASSGPIVNLSGLSQICTQQKKPRAMPGLRLAGDKLLSVAGCHWRPVTAEAVVDAQGDHIYILADPVERTSNDGIGDRE